MDEVWNGLLTCDYEHSRPHATPLEQDLYTRSLTTWPYVLMDDPTPYGRLRRPGIVDIPEPDHIRLVAAWHARLTNHARATATITRALADQHAAAHTLQQLEQTLVAGDADSAAAALAAATRVMLKVMSTHIVNWLLPEQRWETLLTRLFGSREHALECLSALMTPTATGHLLDAHARLLTTATRITPPDDPATAIEPPERVAAELAATTGHLYGATPALHAPRTEDPAHAADLARTIAATTDPAADLAAITDARHKAQRLREAWLAAAILAGAGDPAAVDEVRALAAVLAWAADSEERRKELRHYYLALVRRWCTRTGTDAAHITTTDLLATTSEDLR